jgi:Ras-related protein Rab-5C
MDVLDAKEPSTYKVIALGASGGGKTSIVQRFSSGVFHPDAVQTIGAAYVNCVVPLETGPVTLKVWDTAGQEKFQSLIPLYLRGADACMIVFDLAVPTPTDSLDKLYGYVKDHLDPNVFLVLCGNKFDLISTEPENVSAWAAARDISYFKTSAKTGQNINELFFALAAGARDTKEGIPVTVPASRPGRRSEHDNACC